MVVAEDGGGSLGLATDGRSEASGWLQQWGSPDGRKVVTVMVVGLSGREGGDGRAWVVWENKDGVEGLVAGSSGERWSMGEASKSQRCQWGFRTGRERPRD